MNEQKRYLDHQLSGVTWTQQDTQAVRCAVIKEKQSIKRKPAAALTLAAALILMSTLALAVSLSWGVMDFADRSSFLRDRLPDAPLQRQISQSGGQGREAIVTVTDAVYDGNNVYITLHVTPRAEGTLMMDAVLSLDMPASNLDAAFPRDMSIAQWAEANGFHDFLGVDLSPSVEKRFRSCGMAWHTSEDGSLSALLTFEGVTDTRQLDICFYCATWGYLPEKESFSDDARSDGFTLECSLITPE